MELINRKQVLDILNVDFNYILMLCDEEKRKKINLITKVTIEDIKTLPKIESTPKSEWKQISWKPVIFREVEACYHYRCDNCYVEVRIDHIERYKYCPYCGSYMCGEENENNR